MDGWVDGQVDGWMDGWMDGWTDRWMDGWMDGAGFIWMRAMRSAWKSRPAKEGFLAAGWFGEGGEIKALLEISDTESGPSRGCFALREGCGMAELFSGGYGEPVVLGPPLPSSPPAAVTPQGLAFPWEKATPGW